MGANHFTCVSWGKSAQEAFRQAIDDALYEYGHRGGTGTIAEKGTFRVIQFEPGLLAGELEQHIAKLQYALEQYNRTNRPSESEYNQQKATLRHLKQLRRKIRPRMTPWIYKEICEDLEIGMDKWGPANALKLEGKYEKEYKLLNGLKGKRGIEVWLFWGLAST